MGFPAPTDNAAATTLLDHLPCSMFIAEHHATEVDANDTIKILDGY